jgi:hypothetical protein
VKEIAYSSKPFIITANGIAYSKEKPVLRADSCKLIKQKIARSWLLYQTAEMADVFITPSLRVARNYGCGAGRNPKIEWVTVSLETLARDN